MTFLQHLDEIPSALVHHTGTMVRFTSGQLVNLPPGDGDYLVELPDGVLALGHFRCHPANPYLAGPDIVRWIKSWLPYGQNWPVTVQQTARANTIRIVLLPTPGTAPPPTAQDLWIAGAARRLSRSLVAAQPNRRRVLLEMWERDPRLRHFVLGRWGTLCQVDACSIQNFMPAHLAHSIVDVHHLAHLASGGSNSPMNLCVLCTAHHALVHRTKSQLLSADSNFARIRVNGDELLVVRDVAGLLVR